MPVKVRRSRRASKRYTKSPRRVAKRQVKKTVRKVKTPKRRPAKLKVAAIKKRVATAFARLKPETKKKLKELIQTRMSQMQ